MNKPIDTIEQHRLKLFVERNRFKDLADGYERLFAEERAKNNALKIEIHDIQIQSAIVVSVLILIIILMIGGYVLCPEFLSILATTFQFGSS
ncbi:MAG: hypothetical protein ACN6OV_05430 [Acinetobacter sp.]|uniref:hypothetical protein n=1 Tax=Acinetobacter sp. TaxID=472 RepID=UPI003CFFD058